MSTRINIDYAAMDRMYERVMDEIYLLFHNHPLSFPTGPISEADQIDMNYYQAMGRSALQSLEAQANSARERGDINGLQSISAQAKHSAGRFDPKINPKFAHLPRSGRTK